MSFSLSGSAVTVVSPQASSGPRIIMIEKTAEETVDENNPIVLDLVSAGYTVEQSIDAVEKYRTLEAALNYLETGGEVEEEGEPDVISVLQHQQISREDSDGSVNMDRYKSMVCWDIWTSFQEVSMHVVIAAVFYGFTGMRATSPFKLTRMLKVTTSVLNTWVKCLNTSA